MASRLTLQSKLEEILGSRNVYFQPPSSLKMSYPAIIYSLDDFVVNRANNSVYRYKKRYQLTVIDENPDGTIPEKILTLKECAFVRVYTADGLNHYVFNLYF